MSARDAILATVRANRPAGEHGLPELPDFPAAEGGDIASLFVRNLEAMGGGAILSADAASVLARLCAGAGVVASAVPEFAGNRDLAAVAHPRELADVDIMIARGALGVAETGSVLLLDTALRCNAAAYLAQHLILLLDPAAIVPTVGAAYRRPEFAEHRYASFHTGPSATADIEGVLIHGAQGVRSLMVILAAPTPEQGAPYRS